MNTEVTKAQADILRQFEPERPELYGMEIRASQDRRSLEMRGLIEWVPPIFGNTPMWMITDKGRAALRSLPANEVSGLS